jgi:hypothetical protein
MWNDSERLLTDLQFSQLNQVFFGGSVAPGTTLPAGSATVAVCVVGG